MPEQLLSLEQVTQYLNVDKFTVYRLLAQKKLPAFKVGHQWRFKKRMIEARLAITATLAGLLLGVLVVGAQAQSVGPSSCVALCGGESSSSSGGGWSSTPTYSTPTYQAPVRGDPHPVHPNVVYDGEYWVPAEGYEWVSDDTDDYRVQPVFGALHPDYPNFYWRGDGWMPAAGYQWASGNITLTTQTSGNITVDNAGATTNAITAVGAGTVTLDANGATSDMDLQHELAVLQQQKATLEQQGIEAPVSVIAGEAADDLAAIMDNINVGLAAQDANYRVAKAEYITTSEVEEANTVIAKDVGNKQLEDDFVPFDPRRFLWSGSLAGPDDDITYAVDQTFDATPPLGGLSGVDTTAAIDRAMDTWGDVTCSLLPITLNPDFGIDIGRVAFLFGLGGSPYILADIQHAGWRDIDFFGGILGVTFTFVFIDPSGAVTDIDDNGKVDVAFREIYYDPSFSWADDGVADADVDVETVALHEAGHGLSQAHFGKVWFKENGELKASPRAVMNALYAGPLRSPLGTDKGGHCSNWANWPNN